ncbi:DUF4163 domain-containing protein [Novosphingobium sp. PC22D]|uniref:DUF4163 domain-containing protein n=1 Tax=Novosphingobium sp. PC22D TaxID=1962403 RepID=UPI001F0B32A6|nr:DUF4163 domain-containing protein [Novosphingobium sp. PC22D]
MSRSLAALSAMLLASACQQSEVTPQASDAPPEQATAPAAITMSDEAASAPSPAVDPAAKGRKESVDNDLYEFSYSYPAAAARYPDLREWLDGDLEKKREEIDEAAREDKASATKDGYPYRPHSSGTEWQVVTDLPNWLSLSAQIYTYSGGAHGMTVSDTLLWDKTAQKVREPTELFVSDAALRDAIRKPFCDALDRERAKKRGEPVDRASGDMFTECIDPMESVVILGSAGGSGFDRIGVLVAPYSAGPYAEGSYEVTLPVTPAVLRAVRPEFRGSFSAGG